MSSVLQKEIQRFSQNAPQWWDESGPFAPLHKMNPVRLRYIRDQICRHFSLDEKKIKALTNMNIIDIGCGGGLICEPLSRIGAKVTGLDADPVAIETASAHAKDQGLKIAYLNESAENHKKQYDVVLALEIIEHVNDPQTFVKTCADLCKPGGLIIFSTLNRTFKSMLLGKYAAEYILGWLAPGTHDWRKFIKPSELATMTRQGDLKPIDTQGLVFDPLNNEFRLDKHDLTINYFLCAAKQKLS